MKVHDLANAAKHDWSAMDDAFCPPPSCGAAAGPTTPPVCGALCEVECQTEEVFAVLPVATCEVACQTGDDYDHDSVGASVHLRCDAPEFVPYTEQNLSYVVDPTALFEAQNQTIGMLTEKLTSMSSSAAVHRKLRVLEQQLETLRHSLSEKVEEVVEKQMSAYRADLLSTVRTSISEMLKQSNDSLEERLCAMITNVLRNNSLEARSPEIHGVRAMQRMSHPSAELATCRSPSEDSAFEIPSDFSLNGENLPWDVYLSSLLVESHFHASDFVWRSLSESSEPSYTGSATMGSHNLPDGGLVDSCQPHFAFSD